MNHDDRRFWYRYHLIFMGLFFVTAVACIGSGAWIRLIEGRFVVESVACLTVGALAVPATVSQVIILARLCRAWEKDYRKGRGG